jgi:hypothetical protein
LRRCLAAARLEAIQRTALRIPFGHRPWKSDIDMSKRAPQANASTTKKKNTFKAAFKLSAFLAFFVLLFAFGGDLTERIFGYSYRMEPFEDAPAEVRDDLLYLTYLDSLVRYGRTLPSEKATTPADIAASLARQAGLDIAKQKAWHIVPPDSANPLDALMRTMHRHDRLVLPEKNASLFFHIREGLVQPGYIIFGRLDSLASAPWATGPGVTFVAVLTHTNWFNPIASTLLYLNPNPDGGAPTMVHGPLKETPRFTYWGSGIPGDNLAETYLVYFRRNPDRNRKPLYK